MQFNKVHVAYLQLQRNPTLYVSMQMEVHMSARLAHLIRACADNNWQGQKHSRTLGTCVKQQQATVTYWPPLFQLVGRPAQ